MYATRQDLIMRADPKSIEQLEALRASAKDQAVDFAIQSATELIDTIISARYVVPIQIVTTSLRDACVDIAIYKLYYKEAPTEVRNRYDDAIKLLDKIAAGKANILSALPLTQSEENNLTKKRTAVIGSPYVGSVFSDTIFDKMPKVN